jgi:hypothetical protein
MWADGVFGAPIDAALYGGALVLCVAVAWERGWRLGRPSFRGARTAFWVIAAIGLPIPLHFACGFGMWAGLILFEGLGLSATFGAGFGWLLTPPLVCFLGLQILSALFTTSGDPPSSGQAP